MTPQAQRIAIAEVCGWKCSKFGWWSHPTLPDNGGSMHDCPDYLNDLNAMHQAEKVLRSGLKDEQWSAYTCNVNTAVGTRGIWKAICHATAAQRAEAFLRTLNLWDDSK